ncbi:hypothetical protein HK098_002048 [Nowakowskiella sp. JEL0407]|nr:hypothetical protein HK098_003575 [Nowakowskiella sp. JEL0407]KAJ3123260.1 hypothetical protein HK098_002048 [Nowakowskiella sp. JEL0407]
MSCTYMTFSNICFDSEPLTCSQFTRTVTGSFCNGGAFSTTASTYACNVQTTRTAVSTLGCNLQPQIHSCQSTATQSYSTATVTRVAYVTSGNCYSPLSNVHSYFEVLTFKYGSVNGIVATDPSAPSISNSPVVNPIVSANSGTGDESLVNPNSGAVEVKDNTNNTLLIIVGVACGVIVLIIAIVGVVVVKKLKSRKSANSAYPNTAQMNDPTQPLYVNQSDMRPMSMQSQNMYGVYMIPGTDRDAMAKNNQTQDKQIVPVEIVNVNNVQNSLPGVPPYSPYNENAYLHSPVATNINTDSQVTAMMLTPVIPNTKPEMRLH